MNQWTDAAKQELENYFTRVRPTLRASGADADEVIEDLRGHLDAELSAAKLSIVTEEDVRRLLARIGAPQPSVTEPAAAPKESTPEPTPQTAGFFLLMIAVFIRW
jgi:hypothetical protein